MAIIRHAKKSDASEILRLIRELAEFEKLGHEVKASVDDLETSLFGERAYAEAVVVELNHKLIGYALFFHSYSTFLAKPGIYLEDLYIEPASRGQKYGFLLLQEIARIALSRNCARLDWSVLDWNQKAIEFYKRLGAKPLSDWTTMRLDEEKIKNLARS